MLIIELIKNIIPTKANKLRHAEDYQFNQSVIKELRETPTTISETDHSNYLKLVAEYERRQKAKSSFRNKLSTIFHKLCDNFYSFATRNWPTNPDDIKS